MTEPTALGDLDLAALVSSRICHDVINPVAAIANGLEMLDEEPDQSMRDAAMDLIRKSAAASLGQAAIRAACVRRGGLGGGRNRPPRRREGRARIRAGDRQAPSHSGRDRR